MEVTVEPSSIITVAIVLGLLVTSFVVAVAPYTRSPQGQRLNQDEVDSAIYAGMEVSMSIAVITLAVLKSESLGPLKEVLVPTVIGLTLVLARAISKISILLYGANQTHPQTPRRWIVVNIISVTFFLISTGVLVYFGIKANDIEKHMQSIDKFSSSSEKNNAVVEKYILDSAAERAKNMPKRVPSDTHNPNK